jgi:hypothetical protein
MGRTESEGQKREGENHSEDAVILNKRFRDTRTAKGLKAIFDKASGSIDFASKRKGKSKGKNSEKIWRHRAHLITDLLDYKFSVKFSEEANATETTYDVESLREMFPEFAAAATQFAESLDWTRVHS